jgi:hypothetical protein
MAAQDGDAETVRALIEAKADQTITQDGKTLTELLFKATAAKPHGNAAQAFAESAVDVNMRNAVRECAQSHIRTHAHARTHTHSHAHTGNEVRECEQG